MSDTNLTDESGKCMSDTNLTDGAGMAHETGTAHAAGTEYYRGLIEIAEDEVIALGCEAIEDAEELIRQIEPRCKEFVLIAREYYRMREANELTDVLRRTEQARQFDALEQSVRIALGKTYVKRQISGHVSARIVPFLHITELTLADIERAEALRENQAQSLTDTARALKGSVSDEALAAYLAFLGETAHMATELPIGFVYSRPDDVIVPMCASLCDLGACAHEACKVEPITAETFTAQPHRIAEKALSTPGLLEEVHIRKASGELGRVRIALEGINVSAQWEPLSAHSVNTLNAEELNWILYKHKQLVVTVGDRSLLLELEV